MKSPHLLAQDTFLTRIHKGMDVASLEMPLDRHKPFVSVIQFSELAMKKSLKYLKLVFVCIVSGG